MDIEFGLCIWDENKERVNIIRHGVDFVAAAQVFLDPRRKEFTDCKHSIHEERKFCVGVLRGRIMTVRYVERAGRIRIIGAGYWRKGRRYYEEPS